MRLSAALVAPPPPPPVLAFALPPRAPRPAFVCSSPSSLSPGRPVLFPALTLLRLCPQRFRFLGCGSGFLAFFRALLVFRTERAVPLSFPHHHQRATSPVPGFGSVPVCLRFRCVLLYCGWRVALFTWLLTCRRLKLSRCVVSVCLRVQRQGSRRYPKPALGGAYAAVYTWVVDQGRKQSRKQSRKPDTEVGLHA